MQLWCRIWPPNTSNRICAKQKLLRKHKGACRSSWSRLGSQKSFTLTILWNLKNSVKLYQGIIETSTHHRSEINEFAEQLYSDRGKDFCDVVTVDHERENLVDKFHGIFCYLRNTQDLLSDGRTPNEWRFGESSNSIWFVGVKITPLLFLIS